MQGIRFIYWLEAVDTVKKDELRFAGEDESSKRRCYANVRHVIRDNATYSIAKDFANGCRNIKSKM